MGRFQILEEAEGRLKRVVYDKAPELSIFTLFFKLEGFSLELPQSVLMEYFEPIMDDE